MVQIIIASFYCVAMVMCGLIAMQLMENGSMLEGYVTFGIGFYAAWRFSRTLKKVFKPEEEKPDLKDINP